MRPRVRIAAVAALCALACPAGAQQPAPPALPAAAATAARQPLATIVAEPVAVLIAGCGKPGAATVTRPELAACLARSFASADANHKGAIGYIDYSDWALTWLGDRNALPSPFEIDADGDNRITLPEVQARFDTIFTRLDRDHDGTLTRAELLTIRSGVDANAAPQGKRGKKRAGAPE